MSKSTRTNSKREAIIKAAIKLFSQQGVDGTSVKAIGEVAGVTDAALYKHFSSKSALAKAVFAYYADHYTQLIDHYRKQSAPFDQRISDLIRGIVNNLDEDHFGLLLLSQRHEWFVQIAQEHRLPLTAMTELIADGIDSGAIPPQNPQLTAALLIGALLRLAVFVENGVKLHTESNLEEIRKRMFGLIGLI
ncbi:TetR/AcrR family transcriptional regulator [Desmospora profundinema]|uniref:AcrR family transcriptional regulator n=1 Tax=Desmospora profundinema TaxID=1571184 RepID=A0ABU1IMP2_9BACL|nr:TetR/AcrR family transcriptional regulator [Desmospora profundinema]MDR6225817.1 AcrR family transcriptional regulator [Desmospora profundinema]